MSVCLSICLFVCLSVCLSVCLYVSASLSHHMAGCLPVCLTVCLYVSVSPCVSVSICVSASVSVSVSVAVYVSICLFVYLSVCRRSVGLYICLLVCLSSQLARSLGRRVAHARAPCQSADATPQMRGAALAHIRVTDTGTEICSTFFGRPVMRKVRESLSRRTFTTLELCAKGAQAARALFGT